MMAWPAPEDEGVARLSITTRYRTRVHRCAPYTPLAVEVFMRSMRFVRLAPVGDSPRLPRFAPAWHRPAPRAALPNDPSLPLRIRLHNSHHAPPRDFWQAGPRFDHSREGRVG